MTMTSTTRYGEPLSPGVGGVGSAPDAAPSHTGPDPMDERDKRDRVDHAGFIWSWSHDTSVWEHVGRAIPDQPSLAAVAKVGHPLAFADVDEGDGRWPLVVLENTAAYSHPCGAVSGQDGRHFFICSRAYRHEGPHIAHGGDSRPLALWGGAAVPSMDVDEQARLFGRLSNVTSLIGSIVANEHDLLAAAEILADHAPETATVSSETLDYAAMTLRSIVGHAVEVAQQAGGSR